MRLSLPVTEDRFLSLNSLWIEGFLGRTYFVPQENLPKIETHPNTKLKKRLVFNDFKVNSSKHGEIIVKINLAYEINNKNMVIKYGKYSFQAINSRSGLIVRYCSPHTEKQRNPHEHTSDHKHSLDKNHRRVSIVIQESDIPSLQEFFREID